MTAPRPGARLAAFGLALVLLAASLAVPTSSASFTAVTASAGNRITAITVAPPTNLRVSHSVVLLACRIRLDWDAASPPPDRYRIQRLNDNTGAVISETFTTGTTFSENVPLTILGSPYRWEVRSEVGGWYSEPIVARSDQLLLCLL